MRGGGKGKRVQDRVSRPTGRHRRAEMNPQQQERQAKIPAGRDGWGGPDRERVAWQRAEERWEWEQLQRRRGKALGELEKRSKRGVVGALRASPAAAGYLAKDCRGALGRFRLWRELGGKVREIGGAIRETRKCWDASGRSWRTGYAGSGFRWEKSIPKAVRGIESKAGEFYRDCLLDTGKCAVIRFIAWTYETGFSGESNGKLYRSCRPCSGVHSRSVAVGVCGRQSWRRSGFLRHLGPTLGIRKEWDWVIVPAVGIFGLWWIGRKKPGTSPSEKQNSPTISPDVITADPNRSFRPGCEAG